MPTPHRVLRPLAIMLLCLTALSLIALNNSSASSGDSKQKVKPTTIAAGRGKQGTKSGGVKSGAVSAATTTTSTTLFLAGVEQFGLGSGQIDLYTVTLGGNTAGSDTFAVGSPATLATTNSTNENKPDINNPVDLRFDKSGDLLIANGGTSNADPGSFACVPAGAVTTGTNSSTTITQAGTNPIAFGYLAYDARDGSAAIANNPVSSSTQLFEYLLNGSYSAATAPRNLIAPGFGALSVTEVPALAAGTYAVALQKGAEEDPAHSGTAGSNKVALFSPTGVETDIADDTNFSIDEPYGLAFDSQNNQLVIANNSVWHKLLSFYTVSPVSLVKTINTTHKNTYTATSPDGHVAVAWLTTFGYMQVQVYDNTAARNPVFGPIPYNGTTTTTCSNPSATYIYGNGTAIVNGLKWLSNTKLLVAVESNNSGTPTAKNGFYIYDITNSEVPAGFDDVTCNTFAAAPINTGFQPISLHPFAVAVRGGTFVFADPNANTTTHICNGNSPCYPTITEAIAALPTGGVVNVFGGSYNESVNLNNANVTVNIDGNTTVHAFTLTAGILNAGAGNCGQAGSFTLTLDTGNWTNNGGTFNPGTGTVAFSGTGAQSITGSNVTTFNNLTINSTSTVTPTINTSVGGNLSITSGTFDLLGFTANRTASGGTLSVSNNATLKIGGTNSLPTNYTTKTFGASSTVEYEGSGTQTIGSANYGNLVSSGTGARTLNGSSIGIAGAFTPGTNSYTAPSSTVTFNGSAAQTIPAFTFDNLALSNAAGATLGGNVTVGATLTLTSGTLAVSSNTLTLNGGTSVAAGGLSAASGTVNYNQSSGGQAILGINYGNLTFSNFPKTLPNGGTVKIAGAFLTGAGGGHTVTNSTVEFNGTGSAQTLPSNFTTYNNLTLNNPAGTSGFAGLTVNGLIHVQQGTFTSSSTYNNVQIDNTATLAGTNATTINVSGNWTNAGTFTANGDTVNFDGSAAQSIGGASNNNFNNLTVNNTSGGVSLGSSQAVGATLTLTSGALGVNANTLTLNGAVSFTNGTLTSATVGTVNYNQSSAGQNIAPGTYGTLTFSDFAKTLPNGGTVKIAGAFLTGAGGGHTVTNSTVEFNGTGSAQTLPSNFTTYNNLTLNNASGTTGFDGLISQGLLRVQAGTFSSGAATLKDVQIDSTKTLAATGTSALSVSGNWTNAGTFTANSSTVTFSGNNNTQTIGGASASPFNNLTINHTGTGGVTLGANETVNSALTLSSDLNASTFTLTQPAAGTSSGAFDVLGNVKRIFPATTGSTLSFGNPDNQITINSGTAPSDITVSLVKSAPASFTTAVTRNYTITPNGGSSISATLRLRYNDTPAELNSNVESALGLFRFNGTAWVRVGGSVDTSNNWVELGGITTPFTAPSQWTFSSAKNNSTTTITSDSPDPSTTGQQVTVNFTVASAVTGGPTLTGTVKVTIDDASGANCAGTLTAGAGSCQLTLNTASVPGTPWTLTASYQGDDANYNASSGTASHTVQPPPAITIHDAKAAEPSTGTVSMPFTVTLDHASAMPVSVNIATADNTATGGTCGTAGIDYTTLSLNTLNFAAGETFKVVNVPVCADSGDNTEADETFFVQLSAPTNATLGNTQATGTITSTSQPGTFLITELRTSGPAGLGDDFVELYNNSDTPLTVQASDLSTGYGVFKMGADCNAAPVLIATIPNNTPIPARGHYLLVGSTYSLAAYAVGDQTLTSDIESDANVAVFSTADVNALSSANRLDAVGFGANTGGNTCDLLREGSTLPALNGSTLEYSYFRNMATGLPADTNDNSADFLFADTQATVDTPVAGARRLGAPGPENKTSPVNRGATIKAAPFDPAVSTSADPNRHRDGTPVANGATGTLVIRRTFNNNTGASVTRLRFRVVDMTAGPTSLPGTADLRLLSTTAGSTTITGGGSKSWVAMALDAVPSQPIGGGFNSTVVAIPGNSLPAGGSINVQFTLGVNQPGTFKFFVVVEGLP